MVATASGASTELTRKRYDLAINAGIAGAIDHNLNLGDVLEVKEEAFYAFGAEDAGNLISVHDSGLVPADSFPFVRGVLLSPENQPAMFQQLKKAKGVTVQTVHGNDESIRQLRLRNPEAQLESMEGAAFFYACLQAGVPFIELRSISNYVEPRNRLNWKIEQAINNLNNTLLQALIV
jgi:futalosine hydrolase